MVPKPDIDKILEMLLGDRRLSESATFSSRTYSDQPIIQTGRQMRERIASERSAEELEARRAARHERARRRLHGQLSLQDLTDTSGRPARQPAQGEPMAEPRPRTHPSRTMPAGDGAPVPERYYRLRDIASSYGLVGRSSREGSFAYGSLIANRVFYEQALLMEDFEDQYDFQGTYSQYFPTYSSMTLSQLRGYFSWRTRVRHGEVPEAPLSFAFLYVYELLCGIGTTPGLQGLEDIRKFHLGFRETEAAAGSTFDSYLRRWELDYVAYHGLDATLLPTHDLGMQRHALTLLAAEEATLRSQGLARRGIPLPEQAAPTDSELLEALSACSKYQIGTARLCKDQPDDVAFVVRRTFDALVVHCAKRRKSDFVEGLFGAAHEEPYTMFSSAVFYDPEPHFDSEVAIGPLESLVCVGGRWRHRMACDVSGRSKTLGTILHAVDQMMRARLDYPYPLKQREVPGYVAKIVGRAIDELLEHRAEKERRRISIDLSQLGRIRAAAAVTQEALLTEEEREPDRAAVGIEEADSHASDTQDDASGGTIVSPLPEQDVASKGPGSHDGLLDGTQMRVMQALLAGEDPTTALVPGDPMLSLVIDGINEALFDLVGDAVVEFDGDIPTLVADYEEDVRETLGI